MEKYYDYLDEACDCHLDYDDDGEPVYMEQTPETLCTYCVRRARIAAERAARLARAEEQRAAAAAAAAARLAAHPDREQMVAIRSFLDRVAAIQGSGREAERVEVVRELFTYLLTVGDFLKKHANFRQAVRDKIAEFRADERAASLLPLLSQVEELLVQVETPAAAPAAAAAPACSGCAEGQPNQLAHMEPGGCLSTEE